MSKKLSLREPIWRMKDGRELPLSLVANPHLQRIERWLRGGGKTTPPDGMHRMWYHIIKAEFDGRGLALLTDHSEALKRDPGPQFRAKDSARLTIVDEVFDDEMKKFEGNLYDAFMNFFYNPKNM